MLYKIYRLFLCVAGLLLFIEGCRQIENVFTKESPRQKYVNAIQKSPLADNKNVQRWIAAGDSVLKNPVPAALPFQTKIVFFIDEPNARAWQISLPAGRTVRAHLATPTDSTQIFLDVFTLQNEEFNLLQSAEDSLLSFTPDQPRTLIVRIQPELFTEGAATLTITDQPSMEFPVEEGINADIGSFWGDPRDGGSRQHRGIDIFAERGTPVVAVDTGRVRQAGNSYGIGDITVWLRAGSKSIYYAHLDSVAVREGQNVQAGDTLGFVGNTGNARTTPPHLHFGIYDYGAVNPLPFVKIANERAEPVTAELSPFNKWGRVSSAKANVRPLPSTKLPPLTTLSRFNPVKITGATGGWYRIELPASRTGFIHQSLIEPAASPIRTETIPENTALFNTFVLNKPQFQTPVSQQVGIYGSYNNRLLVQIQDHWMWIDILNDEW